jgi:exonuclease SbcC
MRPHRLRLSAFGAFAGTVEVDLDRLAESGLFLLHGPTGAGKTTLLDGIGFALFGRVPGARQGAKRLRSDHAAQDARTEVQLEVSFGGRRLRITRSPDYERPKLRGTGTTTEKAKVLLEELVGGAWEQRSDRFDEAGLEIADLVGMSAEQFFQVVLLPQGDFAQFLRASSTERAALLEKLFSTERFGAVEGWLAGRRRVTAEAVGAARDAVDLLAARVGEATGCEVADIEVLAWADGLLSETQAAEALALQAVSYATTARDAARAHLDEATALADRQQRRRAALVRRAELAQDGPALLALQQEADAAARAAEAEAVLRDVLDRRTARDEALGAEAVARAALRAAGLDSELDAAALQHAVAQAQQRAGRLAALRDVERGRLEDLAGAAAAQEEHLRALAAVDAQEALLATLPARREQAQARVLAGREAAQALVTGRAERDALAARRPDVVALAQVEGRLVELVQRHLSARESHVALLEKANDLRTASINSMVARLAFALVDETPCPVCGALDHPDPSELRDEGVSVEDEEAARREAEAAGRAVAEVEAQLAAERARAVTLQERVAGLTLARLDAEVAELDLAVTRGAALVADGEQAQAEEEALSARLQAAATDQVAAAGRADAAAARAEDLSARAEAARTRLVAVLEGHESLDEALSAVTQVRGAAAAALAAAEALRTATDELDRATAVAESACHDRGFAGLDDARGALRDDTWRVASTERLRRAADAAAAVAAELADPALEVELDPPAPVTESTAAWEHADALLAERVAEHATASARRTAVERLVPALSASLAELEPLVQRAAEARRLADLCAGQGQKTLRMTLSSFVLAARLEDVAAAASVRLRRMTQGRYELVHTDGAARGGSRSGLGLLARDAWTGQDRDTATLSGGETFLASLALALGLADVVTAEAGGTRIEALFVDEGFGTLDEDTLDEVMDVLDGLREGGRIVGLVSHVAELRQRIPARVEVVKTRAGSDVVLHGC